MEDRLSHKAVHASMTASYPWNLIIQMRSGQVDESHLANIMKKYIWLFGDCPPMEIW